MGAWGYASFANDGVHNILDRFCEKSCYMGQKQADECMNTLWSMASKCRYPKRYNADKHGVVIFILSVRGLKVPIDKLEEVLAIAQHRIKKGVLRYERWGRPYLRSNNVAVELIELGYAIKNDGLGVKRTKRTKMYLP